MARSYKDDPVIAKAMEAFFEYYGRQSGSVEDAKWVQGYAACLMDQEDERAQNQGGES